MKPQAFRADAVMLATGGPGPASSAAPPTRSSTPAPPRPPPTSRARATRTASSSRSTPPRSPAHDKLRLMSESARGEGGRVWVPKHQGRQRDPRRDPREPSAGTSSRRSIPSYGNLVPRDIATREIFHVVREPGPRASTARRASTSTSRTSRRETLDRKLGGILEIYEKFVGRRPARRADEDLPRRALLDGRAVGRLRALGGRLRRRSAARSNHMTNIPGLYAVGECDYQYHGANRLGANSLLSCIYARPGRRARPRWRGRSAQTSGRRPTCRRRCSRRPRRAGRDALRASSRKRDGRENPYALRRGARRADARERHHRARQRRSCDATDAKLQRAAGALAAAPRCSTTATWSNAPLVVPEPARGTCCSWRASSRSARCARDESRGAHYKPEFPKRDDANWLKTTVADVHARRPDASATTRSTPRSCRRSRGSTTRRSARWPARRSNFAIRRQDAPTAAAALGGVLAPLAAEHERHLLPDGDPQEPGHQARARRTTPVTWDCSCLEEVCGACTMLVNGTAAPVVHDAGRPACPRAPITLEPLTKFPVVRDLRGGPQADVRGAEAGARPGSRSTAPTTSGPGPQAGGDRGAEATTRSRAA